MARYIALVFLILACTTSTLGKTDRTETSLNDVTLKALSYFQKVDGHQFDDYFRRIRPKALAPELRAKVLNMLPRADVVTPSADELEKLKTLEPILKYHQRDSVVELEILRVPPATAVFLAGAAVLITEPALNILTAEELQAVVAHELGHEYYWNRYELARESREYSELQELELRCDGIAVITLRHLGVDPESLVSALTKLNQYDRRPGSPSPKSRNYVAFNERVAFIHRMIELVSGEDEAHRVRPSGIDSALKMF
jgi:hypothetical protein